MTTLTPQECLDILENTAHLLQKAQSNFHKSPKQRLTKGYIETRIMALQQYWDTFRNTHQELVRCIPKTQKAELPYFVNEDYFIYEDVYTNYMSDLKDVLATFPPSHRSPGRPPTAPPSSLNEKQVVKLPLIQLPSFSGVYEEWPAYKDLFTSLVHNNASISKVEKLHYLKCSLSGEAETLLKHIQVTENNYEQAWETLNSRYGNKRLIVNSLLKKLVLQKKIPSQTAHNIKSILDTTTECLNSLKNIDVRVDSWDPLIIFLVTQKLDPESHKEWEEFAFKANSEELPTFEDFKKFLQAKFRTLELIAPPSRASAAIRNKEYTVHHVSTTNDHKVRSCSICQEDHTLSHCKEFKKMNPSERCDYVRSQNLCYNCLGQGHSAVRCRLNMKCHTCHRRHHTLVHLNTPPKQVQTHHSNVEEEEEHKANEPNEENIASHFAASSSTALLATALVPVRDAHGNTVVLRALVDQGSQATFISERAAQSLRLKRLPVKGTITGVGATKTTVKHAAEIELLSRHDKNFKLLVKVYVMPTRITSQLPSKSIPTNSWSHINGLVLADPTFYQPGRIDILLGVEVCAQIMKGIIIRGPPNTPCAQDTYLGWILFGNIQEEKHEQDFMVMHINLDLDDLIKTMWELQNEDKKVQTVEERKCEEIYRATHSRTNDGRYVVKLPTKTENLLSIKGETREIALRRLYQLERRLDKDETLKKEYINVMEEYKTMNHIEEVSEQDINNPAVYLPHHAVVKEDKETTKVRTVFNASQKGKNGVSLNDELLVGPQLQEDMRNLIMRWRMKRICYVADVQKMYRQIIVREEDRDLQRIVWRCNKDKPVKDYRLTRVTFGTASAPYLAVKTLHQIAEDEGTEYPEAARCIKEDFYMDDLMSGNDTPKEAIKIAKEIDAILRKGGFVLQKWCSNNAEFLQEFAPSQRSTYVNLDIVIDGTIRALGVSWNMGKDVFKYKLNLPAITESITKRIILADIQRLFDPLGWLAPATLPAKLLIQKLWLQGLTWDEEVDDIIGTEWIQIRRDLLEIDGIEIDRWLHTTDEAQQKVTIHGFCDASIKAYAAVAYVRVVKENGDIYTGIIAAKTRVAPIKPTSLPRLELCGALLLSRLLKQIKEATRIPDHQIYAWTDSTIVLSWLHGDPTRWQTFIRNRVVEIIDNVGRNWYHVQTQENPADVASRGSYVSDLKVNKLWWYGPEWLREEVIDYKTPNDLMTKIGIKENIHVNLKIENKDDSLAVKFEEFNNLTELLKTITYCRRFLKGKEIKNKDTNIRTEELEESLKTCVRLVQRDNFEEDISNLRKGKDVKKNSRIKRLQPYLDKENILRVGGRLRHSNMDEDSKHPIILDDKNYLTILIIADAHQKTLHGGVQLMMSYLRSKFWILKAKNLVKRRIHKCLTCAKHSVKTRMQLMGDLPSVRVTPARPFLNSGVDFAGPYQVLMSTGRGAKTNKAYVAIFVCMSVKAIHLELVGDLTAESFIGAFKRFVARRGKCAQLWSDQGRNFIGANKELTEAWAGAKLQFDGPIAESLAMDGTQWNFIPPYSPHMGGLWEAGVKSMKHHLKRIMTSHLTFEEMTTLLCQIEACLNSRPLQPIDDSDPNSLVPLTPGHFLIGESPVTIPSPDISEVHISHLSRWQHLQKLLSNFWHRWQQEYLSRLQQRPKWLKKVKEFEIGNIVLIKQDGLPPGKWSMGRIVEKHPGADGVTRVYSIKSGDHVSQRSVTKLCPLPIDIRD